MRSALYGFAMTIVVLSGLFIHATPAQAAPPLIPECATVSAEDVTKKGCDNACYFLAFFGNLTQFILQYSSAVVMLMIFVGGVIWTASAGNQTMVQRGQQIIVGAIIGLLFVMLSWLIVNLVMRSFTGASNYSNVRVFGTVNWYQFCLADRNAEAIAPEEGE